MGRRIGKSEREEISRLRRSANTGDLTSLSNRAFFRRAAQRMIDLSKNNDLSLAAIVLNIDDFKPYNDQFGHDAGDAMLRHVGRVLRESTWADERGVRHAHAHGALPEAAKAAERVRSTLGTVCTPESNVTLRRPVTVSVGVAPLTAKTKTLEDLIEAADRERYQAKRAGKNHIYGTERGAIFT